MSSEINLLPDFQVVEASMLHRLHLMKIMAQMGCHRAVVATLLQLAGFPLAHVRYVGGAVILHQSEWAKNVPEWLINACIVSRIEQISSEYAKNDSLGALATATEVLTALYPATFDAPLPHYLYQIYAWCWNETIVKYNHLPKNCKNGWEILNVPPIEFDGIKADYYPLARTIRHKVIATAKSTWKKHPSSNKTSTQNQPPLFNQVTLFNL